MARCCKMLQDVASFGALTDQVSPSVTKCGKVVGLDSEPLSGWAPAPEVAQDSEFLVAKVPEVPQNSEKVTEFSCWFGEHSKLDISHCKRRLVGQPLKYYSTSWRAH